jgi:hypothetical protein
MRLMPFFYALIFCAASLQGQYTSAPQPEPLKTSGVLPELRANGGLRFDSQGASTPNTLSGYGFLPLFKGNQGDVLFAEAYLNWYIGSEGLDSTVGCSTRLGYRWLNSDDFKIGANAIFRATVENNRVLSLGSLPNNIGDNGITIDLRGNSDNVINIFSNFINNAEVSAIGMSLQNTASGIPAGNSVINISGNTFGPGVNSNIYVSADRVINTGNPVSTYNVNGTGDNALTNSNVTNKSYGNPGNYPSLYLNGVQFLP